MNKTVLATSLLVCLAVLMPAQAKPSIQVIVEPAQPLPVNHPMAPQPLGAIVVKMLEKRGYEARHLQSGNISLGDTALRVLYTVSERKADSESLVAASAATSLIQRAKLYESTLTLSLFSGVQQSVVEESTSSNARQAVLESFKTELGKRLDKALAHLESAD